MRISATMKANLSTMNAVLTDVLSSKLSAKKKARAIADALSGGSLKPEALLEAGRKLPRAELAILIESLESATRKQPALAGDELFALLVESLADPAPRVRWEAARTVGNVASQHAGNLRPAARALLDNTANASTVVRWAAAQALTAILKTGYAENSFALQLTEIAAREQDDGVRRVYEKAIRAAK